MKNSEIGELLLREAENGNVDAQVDWATWRSVHNSDTPLNSEEVKRVVSFYEAGTLRNNSTAYLNLGAMYYTGEYVEQDYGKAVELYERAAELGETQALCNLGYCYYYGRHTETNYEKAFMCFIQAALFDNNCNAFYKLGDMYMNGDYVAKNASLAYALYERAFDSLEANDPNLLQADVYMRLGECYLYGKGCEKDAVDALRYLTQSECYYYRKIQANLPFSREHLTKVRELIEIAKSNVDSELGIITNVM